MIDHSGKEIHWYNNPQWICNMVLAMVQGRPKTAIKDISDFLTDVLREQGQLGGVLIDFEHTCHEREPAVIRVIAFGWPDECHIGSMVSELTGELISPFSLSKRDNDEIIQAIHLGFDAVGKKLNSSELSMRDPKLQIQIPTSGATIIGIGKKKGDPLVH